MEEHSINDPAAPAGAVPDLSPEARRKDALRWRAGLQERLELHTGAGSRFATVVKRVWTGAYNDGFIHAGNLAYMAILALFPFFITVAAIFSLVGEQSQRAASINAFLLAVPPIVSKVIAPVARDVVNSRSGWLLWAGGVVGLWTVGSLIETFRDILRRAYGTQATQAFWRYRLLSTGVIIAAVVLLLFSLLAQLALSAAQDLMAAWLPYEMNSGSVLLISRIVPAIVLYCSLFLLFLSLTPSAYRGGNCPKWPGALFVTVWWIAVTLLLPTVLHLFFRYDLTYGSLAGIMITLFFFWLVGLGIVIGAELNAALSQSNEERDMLGQADNRARASASKQSQGVTAE